MLQIVVVPSVSFVSTSLGISVVLLSAVAPGAASTQPPPAVRVDMTNHLSFKPQVVTIDAGESVLWVNDSDLLHSATAHPEHATTERSYALPPGAEPFHSGPMAPGERFVHRFEVPGTYKYFCVPHETAAAAHGWIHVRPRR